MYEVPCSNKSIAPNGFVSKALLEAKGKAFTELFPQGCPWLQLHFLDRRTEIS